MTQEWRMAAYSGAKVTPLEEQIERFEEKIGQRRDPEKDARAALKAWQESRGIEYDENAPLPPDILAAMEKDRDEEIPGHYMGDPSDPGRRG